MSALHTRRSLMPALTAISLFAWAYLVYQDWAMRHMDIVFMAMPGMDTWDVGDLFLVLTMWSVMMVAMMLPSAMPMILLFDKVSRSRHAALASRWPLTWVFIAGYLMVWGIFSIVATLLQWKLHEASMVSSTSLRLVSHPLGGALLVAAGLYQWAPVKRTCLEHCRSPLDFLMMHWREGNRGAFVMGLLHGAYCAGCCSVLMLLLFAVGVMNIAWIATLSLLVLVEKTVPHGLWLARVAGLLLVAWGAWLAVQP